jgi:hypothetical protein
MHATVFLCWSSTVKQKSTPSSLAVLNEDEDFKEFMNYRTSKTNGISSCACHGLLLVVRNTGGIFVCKFYLFMRIAFLWRNLDIFRISMKVLSCMH